MVGELPDAARAAGSGFRHEGDLVALVGPFAPALAGSELAKQRGELGKGLPAPDVEAAAAACAAVREAVRAGAVVSAHDVSDGGLSCALAEAAIAGGIGVRADLRAFARERRLGDEEALFGEGAGGFLVSGAAGAIESLEGDADVLVIGEVAGDAVEIQVAEETVTVALAEAEAAWLSLRERAEGIPAA
jgi:phosphoribosylformylglycinamidine synthase